MGHLSLSWTMANRYDRCPELARAWKHKEVTYASDERPFFMGRVVHAAFEAWLLAKGVGPSIPDLFSTKWPVEESLTKHIEWKTVTDRDEVYAEGLRVCEVLERDSRAIDLLALNLQPEVKGRAVLNKGLGISMYVQADIMAEHPTEPVLYVVELKSGKSFSRAQVAWYAAAIQMIRRSKGMPERRLIGLSLRPALERSVEILDLTQQELDAQQDRAMQIAKSMLDEQWAPTPNSYCGICEARGNCPSYQQTFSSLSTGVVNLGT